MALVSGARAGSQEDLDALVGCLSRKKPSERTILDEGERANVIRFLALDLPAENFHESPLKDFVTYAGLVMKVVGIRQSRVRIHGVASPGFAGIDRRISSYAGRFATRDEMLSSAGLIVSPAVDDALSLLPRSGLKRGAVAKIDRMTKRFGEMLPAALSYAAAANPAEEAGLVGHLEASLGHFNGSVMSMDDVPRMALYSTLAEYLSGRESPLSQRSAEIAGGYKKLIFDMEASNTVKGSYSSTSYAFRRMMKALTIAPEPETPPKLKEHEAVASIGLMPLKKPQKKREEKVEEEFQTMPKEKALKLSDGELLGYVVGYAAREFPPPERLDAGRIIRQAFEKIIEFDEDSGRKVLELAVGCFVEEPVSTYGEKPKTSHTASAYKAYNLFAGSLACSDEESLELYLLNVESIR